MENGVHPKGAHAPPPMRAIAMDARAALLLAERAISQAIDDGAKPKSHGEGAHAKNAFGESVAHLPPLDVASRVQRLAERASAGERVGFVSHTHELLGATLALAEIAAHRLAVVVHLVEPRGAEVALAFGHLGWGMLFASDVEESVDLTLVARRAAEDSGTPFFVVHDVSHARRVEPIAPLGPAFLDAFVGHAPSRVRPAKDPAHPAHAQVGARAFAERAQFALASALRELDGLTGRKRDVVTRSVSPGSSDPALMLVGLGALGDVLLGEVARLRAAGHDVGALKVTALRPFPGPRLVRILSRALAVTVVEHEDEVFAQSNPLTRELKAGFSDAMTWAPEYPGVGRIPRIHSGVARHAVHDVSAGDIDAIVRNMLAGEQGKRFFVLGGEAPLDLPQAPPEPATLKTDGSAFHLRALVRDVAVAAALAELASAVIANVLSLKVRAILRPAHAGAEGACTVDLVASAPRPIGAHVATAATLVVLDDVGALLQGNPIARLGTNGTVAVPTRRDSAEALWADLPPYVKAVVFDRDARVVGWEAPDAASLGEDQARWLVAAAIVGVTLGTLARSQEGEPHVDAALVERDVVEALATLAVSDDALAARAGAAARRTYEASVQVPRGVVELDHEGVRLGRQDARAAATA